LAQQSSDAQQPACAADAAAVIPSAITANSSITLSFFIIFSFEDRNGFGFADRNSARNASRLGVFLNAQNVDLVK
jgi:hypothetical protein